MDSNLIRVYWNAFSVAGDLVLSWFSFTHFCIDLILNKPHSMSPDAIKFCVNLQLKDV